MVTKDDFPLVSVVMPIYNEEKYIRETLNSILDQDYTNLEILISDNQSTDKTASICDEFKKKDSRISFYRHPENIGAGPNHIFTLNKINGDYLMFAAGHDKWSPNLVSECVKVLENFQTATLAYGTPTWIDENGNPFEKFSGWYDTRGLNPVARFLTVFWGGMNPILGIHRTKDFPDIKKYNFTGADLVVLAELSLKGEFIHATNATFQRRQNRPAENYNDKLQRYKSNEMKVVTTSFFKLFPLAKLPIELLRIVFESPIKTFQKIFILALLLPSFPVRYFLGRKDHNFYKEPS